MMEVEEEVQVPEPAEEKPRGETQKLEPGSEALESRPRRAETIKLEPQPETVPEAIALTPHLGLGREEMNWAAVAHASVLVTLASQRISGV